jgi:hypothetical protein
VEHHVSFSRWWFQVQYNDGAANTVNPAAILPLETAAIRQHGSAGHDFSVERSRKQKTAAGCSPHSRHQRFSE